MEKFDKEYSEKDDKNSHLKNHIQSLIAQITKLKNKKESQQNHKESKIHKEPMTNPV